MEGDSAELFATAKNAISVGAAEVSTDAASLALFALLLSEPFRFIRARRTREQLARELEGGSTPAAGAHFAGMRFGRLLAGTAHRQWVVP